MEYEPKYTVVLRGQEFVLTKSQIEFDSPNYFTACFLGDFREAQTRRLELSRNPDLFKLIVEYLCGYDIMPLNDKAIPSYMTLETGLQNLRADALFYQLGGLVTACDSFIKPRDPPVPPSRSFLVVGYTTTSRILSGTDPNSVSVSMLEWENPGPRDKNKWMTLVTEDTLGRMGRIQSPKSYTDFQGLRTVAAIEKLTSKLAGNYRQDGWKLKGWRIETVTPPEAPDSVRTEILIILGDFRSNAPKK